MKIGKFSPLFARDVHGITIVETSVAARNAPKQVAAALSRAWKFVWREDEK